MIKSYLQTRPSRECEMNALNHPELLRNQSYINGQWVNTNDGKTFPVQNPYDGSLLTELADLGAAEAEVAIHAADKAWREWRKVSVRERSNILLRWARLLEEHLEDNAKLLTLEQGKPLAQAQSDTQDIVVLLEWYAGEALRVHGQTLTPPNENLRLRTIKQPIGVVAAIAPWNYPSYLYL